MVCQTFINCCNRPVLPVDCPYTVTRCDGTTYEVNGRFGTLKIETADGRFGDQPYNIWIQSFYYDLTEELNAGDTILKDGRSFLVESIQCNAAVCRCVARVTFVELFGCLEDIDLYSKTHRPGCENGTENVLALETQAIVWQHSSSTGQVLGAERFERMYRFYLNEDFSPSQDTIVWWDNRGFRIEDEIDVDRPRRKAYLLTREIAWQPSPTTCVCSNLS